MHIGFEHPSCSLPYSPSSSHSQSPSDRGEKCVWTPCPPFLLAWLPCSVYTELPGSRNLKGQSSCLYESQWDLLPTCPSAKNKLTGPYRREGNQVKKQRRREPGKRKNSGKERWEGGRHLPVCGTLGSCHPQEDAAPGPRRCSWQ